MNKKITLLTVILLILGLSTLASHSSKIFYNKISLKELISSSPYIFLVEKSDPFITKESRNIHWNIFMHKPYQQTIYNFKVVEQLKTNNDPSIDTKIRVAPAYNEWKFIMYQKYALEGIRKSPIYEKYDTLANFDKEKRLVVFLSKKEKGYELFCTGAYESPAKKDIILKKLGNKKTMANNIMQREGYIKVSGGCEVYTEANIIFKPKDDKIQILIDNKGGYFWKDNKQMQRFSATIDRKSAEDFFNKLNFILSNRKATESASTRNATVKVYLPLKEKKIEIKWNELEEVNGKMHEIDPVLDLIDEFIRKISHERSINRNI